MIGLELKGRLGNQMFRYAFMRAYIQRCGVDKHEIIFGLEDMAGKDAGAGWENSLDYFNILPHKHIEQKIVNYYGNCSQKIISKFYYALGRIFSVFGRNLQLAVQDMILPLMISNGLFYSLNNKSIFNADSDKIFIDGSFENEKYFASIRDILLEEFTPIYDKLPSNSELYEVIENSNSVCVSVRRGDFLTKKNQGLYDICNEAYFLKGVKWFKDKLFSPNFIFFSDDIDWARNKFGGDSDIYFESGNDPVWEKLRLMYSCKHFIISNSTFSWWAQYLSRNPDKIVISPKIWYRDNRPQFLIQDNYIKL